MEIAPNSTIVLYRGIPLTPTYENTYWFDTLQDQIQFFHTVAPNPYVKMAFNNQYYTRVNRGQIKVKVCADDVYDCNYLSFQNTAYGSKWFYAFITSIEWINNEVTLITFQIDVMQTYLFDHELRECLVEREHSISDNVGDNIEQEPFVTGTYVANPVTSGLEFTTYEHPDLADMCYIVGVLDETLTEKLNIDIFTHVNGKIIDKVYTGLSLHAFTDKALLNDFLDKYKKVPDNVLMIYTCPRRVVSSNPAVFNAEGGYEIPDGSTGANFIWNATGLSASSAVDGYVPLNKKLYTFPYNFFMVSDSTGNSMDIRYEFCENLTPSFNVQSSIIYPPSVRLCPTYYKNLLSDETEILNESSYPLCSWVSDYWQMAMAQQILPEMERSLSGNLIDLTAPEHMNTPVGTSYRGMPRIGKNMNQAIGAQAKQFMESDLPSFVNHTAHTLNDTYYANVKAKAHAEIFSGSPSSPSLGISKNLKTFLGCRYSVNHHNAKRIDEFFSAYGYACNEFKTPNRKARSRFTYVKTIGCSIIGNMPADDVANLQSIYDNGVRFWVDKTNFGVYPKVGVPTSYNNILSGA